MKLSCKHCGTSFSPVSDGEEFCCNGCRHVHELIRTEGLDTYYALQDRVGAPVGDLPESGESAEMLSKLQSEAEAAGGDRSQVTVRLTGMSCLGCVWLVERLARAQPACVFVQASLQSNTLTLSWQAGDFDLTSLAKQLLAFGYGLSPRSDRALSWSPLTWRTVICSMFAGNALFLSVLFSVLDGTSEFYALLQLLFVAMTALSLLVGLPQFLLPVVRALKMQAWHHDGLLCFGVICLFPSLWLLPIQESGWMLPVVLSLLLLTRMGHVYLWSRLMGRFGAELSINEDKLRPYLKVLSFNSLLVAGVVVVFWIRSLFVESGFTGDSAAALCLVFATYPLVVLARYRVPWVIFLFGILIGWGGVALVMLGALGLIASIVWMFCSGVLSMLLFVVWQHFCRKL